MWLGFQTKRDNMHQACSSAEEKTTAKQKKKQWAFFSAKTETPVCHKKNIKPQAFQNKDENNDFIPCSGEG